MTQVSEVREKESRDFKINEKVAKKLASSDMGKLDLLRRLKHTHSHIGTCTALVRETIF